MIRKRIKDFMSDKIGKKNKEILTGDEPEIKNPNNGIGDRLANPNNAIGDRLALIPRQEKAVLHNDDGEQVAVWENAIYIGPGDDDQSTQLFTRNKISRLGGYTEVRSLENTTFDKLRIEYNPEEDLLEYYNVEG